MENFQHFLRLNKKYFFRTLDHINGSFYFRSFDISGCVEIQKAKPCSFEQPRQGSYKSSIETLANF